MARSPSKVIRDVMRVFRLNCPRSVFLSVDSNVPPRKSFAGTKRCDRQLNQRSMAAALRMKWIRSISKTVRGEAHHPRDLHHLEQCVSHFARRGSDPDAGFTERFELRGG